MPYPVVHVLFFVFCISAAAVYAVIRSSFRRELLLSDSIQIIFLLSIGTLSALLPDVPAVYNLIVNDNAGHCWIGPVPTHSILFSFSALIYGTLAGLIAYGKFRKAIFVGLFAEAAFLSHLWLDDAHDGNCAYLYPIYNKSISVFSLMAVTYPESDLFHYLIKSFISVFFIAFIIMIALFALSQLGFEFRYRSEK
jgi:LexA-binding, inner membrane-associated putative hydrolase